MAGEKFLFTATIICALLQTNLLCQSIGAASVLKDDELDLFSFLFEPKPMLLFRRPAAALLPVGWIYGFIFNDDQCSALQVQSAGIQTNACLTPAADNDISSLSYLYTCNQVIPTYVIDSFTRISYSSPDCTPSSEITRRTVEYSCDYRNFFLQCTGKSSIDLAAEYILTKYYDEATCAHTVQFTGLRNNACIPTRGADSLFYSYPKAYFYSSVKECSGNFSVVLDLRPLTGQCESARVQDDDYSFLPFQFIKQEINSTVTAQSLV
eukprot:scaffold13700_cov252-Ochromonas_danica.AAC.3